MGQIANQVAFSTIGKLIGKISKKGKENFSLKVAKESDFECVKATFIDIINNTPDMEKHARWVYGEHPTDEEIKKYIKDGNMYLFLDGNRVAGVVAITFFQGEEYHGIEWQTNVLDNEAMVLHLLGVVPGYRGSGTGARMLQEIFLLGKAKKMKTCRIDTLASNTPAQKFYSKLGFKYCGKQHWYADNTGWTDFLLYEYILE